MGGRDSSFVSGEANLALKFRHGGGRAVFMHDKRRLSLKHDANQVRAAISVHPLPTVAS